ncbi:unnamed protein product [Durusdinium trenchii]|uniref:Uncharacterized protein n=2 Tax=Durusdinium trenchii TaxID=1381693 RepID=A0ABP0QIJ9_9DINO
MKSRGRVWVLCIALLLGRAFVPPMVETSRVETQRRAMFLGMMAASVPTQANADTKSAANKLKECEAEVNRILGGLSTSASNVLAMTPAQVGEVNTRGPPKMGSFESSDGPCSASVLRTAAEALAKSPPSGLNRQEREKLEAGPKRIVEAREAIVEANKQKQGARLFGAAKKYMEATNSLLVAAS